MNLRWHIAALTALIVGSLVPIASVWAQPDAYPSRPVRILVPFPPGGSVDTVARLIAPKLGEGLGQPVVIDNRSGASGNIGTEQVARAKPDGYTLLLNTVPLTSNPHLFKQLPFDVLVDFAPIMLISSSPSLVVVHPSVPARTVLELVELARSKPGGLNYSSAGVGTNPHISGELFNFLAKVNIIAIQFKGGGPALAATLGGEIGITFNNIADTLPHVKSGRLRVLGTTGARRSQALPDVPTIAEAGLTGYEFTAWHGLLGPRDVPAAHLAAINAKLQQALRTPELAKRFDEMGLDIVASTQEAFGAHLKSEHEKWGRLVKERNIRSE